MIHILFLYLTLSCSLIAVILGFLLKIASKQKVLNVKMTGSSKKRKRTSSQSNNQNTVTSTNRTIIDANWHKFLSSNLMDKTQDAPIPEEKKEHFTGTFRRSRKKKHKNQSIDHTEQHNLKNKNSEKELPSSVETNLKSLNITAPVCNGNVNNVEEINDTNKSVSNEIKLTKFIALDCEMVGIGYMGNDNMLARVSMVNKFGDCIYDKFVKAREEVIDYRTSISGITPELMKNGEEFSVVQKEVAEIIRGRILVGHSLSHDLSVLFLSHPKRNIRDTSKYKPFRKITKGSTPSLKRLAKEILGADIQIGQHSSVVDARAVMQLYNTVAKKWESSLSQKRGYSRKFVES